MFKVWVNTMKKLIVNKVVKVNLKIDTQVQAVAANIATKLQKCVDVGFYERHLKEKKCLGVRIGGLPQAWDTNNMIFYEFIAFLPSSCEHHLQHEELLPQ